jgi:hypothetical protein
MIRGTLSATFLAAALLSPGTAPLAAPAPGGTAQGEPVAHEVERPRRTVSGYPRFRLSDWQIGGTASWTADGDPPAGNHELHRPWAGSGPGRTGSESGERGDRAPLEHDETGQ